jgi:hypothetical protein
VTLGRKNNSAEGASPEPVDYERLGRMMEVVFMTGYVNRVRYFRMAFLKGVFAGLGSVIGASIVVAIALWTLSLFETLPLIGPVSENIQKTVETQN